VVVLVEGVDLGCVVKELNVVDIIVVVEFLVLVVEVVNLVVVVVIGDFVVDVVDVSDPEDSVVVKLEMVINIRELKFVRDAEIDFVRLIADSENDFEIDISF